jgi:hypothetical protein
MMERAVVLVDGLYRPDSGNTSLPIHTIMKGNVILFEGTQKLWPNIYPF